MRPREYRRLHCKIYKMRRVKGPRKKYGTLKPKDRPKKQNRNDWREMGSGNQWDEDHYQKQLKGSGLLSLAIWKSLVTSLRAISEE